jgi:hypothetical protein
MAAPASKRASRLVVLVIVKNPASLFSGAAIAMNASQ